MKRSLFATFFLNEVYVFDLSFVLAAEVFPEELYLVLLHFDKKKGSAF